ncbi:MAG: pyrroline-5-carboxylate reductase [Pseudomonadales bacterium]|jgi:pyrroline-5-carboxylate reductase|nr:pyrroline-5-carboxylate reductase [Pseudomonadales bacterium]
MNDSTAAATPRLAFVGGGNMARSLVGGLLAADYPASHITVSEPHAQTRAGLATMGPIRILNDNAAAVAEADLVVLAVKPQVMAEVLAPLRGALEASATVLLSIAAGITVSMLRRWAGAVPIVRCMPNTPALVGAGMSALYATGDVDVAGRALASRVLEAGGAVLWLEDEALMDAVTATSGSGPAYFFRVMEAMIDGACRLGLPETAARTLVLQTALGAARMALESDTAPGTLRQQVTSPGGTTAAALAAFDAEDLAGILTRGMDAAARRSAELARELDR